MVERHGIGGSRTKASIVYVRYATSTHHARTVNAWIRQYGNVAVSGLLVPGESVHAMQGLVDLGVTDPVTVEGTELIRNLVEMCSAGRQCLRRDSGIGAVFLRHEHDCCPIQKAFLSKLARKKC